MLRIIRTGLLAALVGAAVIAFDARAQYDCSGVAEFPNTTLAAYKIVSGLTGIPVLAAAPKGDRERLFLVEQQGRIFIHPHGSATNNISSFLDIVSRVASFSGEMGLLGLAFDPDYATTGHFWVNYTENAGGEIYTVIARYTASPPTSNVVDPATEMRVLRVVQPEFNHNGGMLLFGLDGFLYVFTGDGGGGGDIHGPCGNGQNRSVLLGKILRLDVRGVSASSTLPDCGLAGANYRVPESNPMNDGPGAGFCDEIWSYGLRNPWRSTMDAMTGDLYTADVGQECWEEVNWAAGSSPGGENYGWRQMEGNACYTGVDCDPIGLLCGNSPPCHDPSLAMPVVTYSHPPACSVIGGYVYRGCRMPNIRGRYFHSDLCDGAVRTFRMVGGVATEQQDITLQLLPDGSHFVNPVSFGIDGIGEQYLLAYFGEVWKLAPPFHQLEVSARGAADMLRLAKTGDWTWEDLFHSTDVAVTRYRVYRGGVGGQYSCVFNATTPKWPAGGDPANPAPGQLFTYVVTAVDGTGQEAKPGTIGTFGAAGCP